MIIVALNAKTDYGRLDSILVVAIANLLRQPHFGKGDPNPQRVSSNSGTIQQERTLHI